MGLCLGQRMKAVDMESYTPTERKSGQLKWKMCTYYEDYEDDAAEQAK